MKKRLMWATIKVNGDISIWDTKEDAKRISNEFGWKVIRVLYLS